MLKEDTFQSVLKAVLHCPKNGYVEWDLREVRGSSHIPRRKKNEHSK